MIPFDPAAHRIEHTKQVRIWTQRLQTEGHSPGEWESTPPGIHFSAGCICLKCGLIFLGEYFASQDEIHPLPMAKIHASPCNFPAWITESQVCGILRITPKRWRNWLSEEKLPFKIPARIFSLQHGLRSCERNGHPETVCFCLKDVKDLLPWVQRREDKIGRTYITLKDPDAEPKKDEEPLCPSETNSEPASSEKPRKSRSGTKKRASA